MYIPYFIYSSVDGYLSYIHFLAIMNNGTTNNILVWVFVHTRICVDIYFSIPLGIYLGMELLGHMVTLRLTFWGNAKLFSKKHHHFTLSPAMYEDSNISTSSSILVIFFIVALVGVKWYPTVILIHSFNFIIGQLDKTKLKNILKCLNSLFFKFKQNDSKLVLFSFKFCIGFFSAFR